MPSGNRQDGKFFALTVYSSLQTFYPSYDMYTSLGRLRAISSTLNSLHNPRHPKGPLQKLIEWPGLGSIRRYRDTSFEISSGPRSIPSSFLQEHAGNRTSHQWLEVGAGSEIPRERSGAQGGRANATVCWRYWPCCTGYVASSLSIEWPAGGADFCVHL